MAGAFGFVLDFFRRVAAAGHPESVYHIVNWNYMPPAGSSLIHPHLQVFSTSSAPNLMRQEIAKPHNVPTATPMGSTYWDDLVAAEKDSGERYLGYDWPYPLAYRFCTHGGRRRCPGRVVEDARCTLDLTGDDLAWILPPAWLEADEPNTIKWESTASI
jgi:hypothetical protein